MKLLPAVVEALPPLRWPLGAETNAHPGGERLCWRALGTAGRSAVRRRRSRGPSKVLVSFVAVAWYDGGARPEMLPGGEVGACVAGNARFREAERG